MLRLHVLSDLHLRYAPFTPPPVTADVVVLAGDIDRGTLGMQWARRQFASRPVLYVLGNHEFYRALHEDVLAAARAEAQASQGHIRLLDDAEWVYGQVAFLGATLWTGFDLFGRARRDEVMRHNGRAVRDFHRIQVRRGTSVDDLAPEDARAWYLHSLAWLRGRVAWHRGRGRKTCVITHFAPSRGSLAERHRTDPVSAYFVNALDDWLGVAGPDLWIHGHTHDGFDYHVGATRVVCNTRGYPQERELTDSIPFDPARVIEI